MDLNNLTPEELEQLKKLGPGRLMAIPESEIRWPGFVNRNELASFCQDEAIRLNAEISDLWDAMQSKKIDDDTYESLFAKHYMSLGKVLGLRQIMEFCATHKKTEEEMWSEEEMGS